VYCNDHVFAPAGLYLQFPAAQLKTLIFKRAPLYLKESKKTCNNLPAAWLKHPGTGIVLIPKTLAQTRVPACRPGEKTDS